MNDIPYDIMMYYVEHGELPKMELILKISEKFNIRSKDVKAIIKKLKRNEDEIFRNIETSS